jgi:hypothetical protein
MRQHLNLTTKLHAVDTIKLRVLHTLNLSIHQLA